jgi:hypothetical protein
MPGGSALPLLERVVSNLPLGVNHLAGLGKGFGVQYAPVTVAPIAKPQR